MSIKVQQRKDVKNVAEYEEPSVMHDLVFKEPIYFNILECGKNILNQLDATYE